MTSETLPVGCGRVIAVPGEHPSASPQVNAAVSVSAVDLTSAGGRDAEVHIVPIVHITNQTACSDTSSLGNSSTLRPPPQRRSADTQTEEAPPRRRERRPRRTRPASVPAASRPAAEPTGQTQLPDILNSHLPPPYSTLPQGQPAGRSLPPPPLLPLRPPPPTIPPPRAARCLPEEFTLPGRRLPYRTAEEEDPKSCCGIVVSQSVSIRWFIVMIAFVGLCCAIVGTVLGALKATGREHLTVSLLMIGVGIVLITVSGIAWRLTSRDSPSCRTMLGLVRQPEEPADPRRFLHRHTPAYGRPHHPYAAMVYPEFQFRPPPPSYHASMQAYRLGLLLDRQAAAAAGHTTVLSPPPAYRNHGSLLRAGMNTLSGHSEYSQPPSYHSRQSSNPQPTGRGHSHSRQPSVLSFLSHESLVYGPPLDGVPSRDGVSVIPVLQTGSLDSGKARRKRRERDKRAADKDSVLPEVEVKCEEDLVTIVQTDSGPEQPSVVVTVTGCGEVQPTGEVQILAHL